MGKQIDYHFEQNADRVWRLLDGVPTWDNGKKKKVITENEPFGAKLTIIDVYNGRSSAGVSVKVEGHIDMPVFVAYMTINDFLKLIQRNVMDNGVISSVKLKFRKQGRSHFITPA